MKKILFLILILFVIKLNAWQLITREYDLSNQNGITYYFDYSANKIRFIAFHNGNGTLSGYSPDDTYFWSGLSNVRVFNGRDYYKTTKYINNRFKEEPQILNDFYINGTQSILNYFYNPNNSYSKANHINYANYEILYNSDGLAVESIVNNVWAGLYDDSERGVSGRLYSSGGQLLYVNGHRINWMESQMIKLIDMVSSSISEVIAVLGSMFPYIVAAVFVLLILYYVVSVGRRAIMPSNVKVRKRFHGSYNDEC